MKTDWIRNLRSVEDKEKFKREFDSAKKVLDRQKEIVYNYIKELGSDVSDYDSPSWAYRAADINGQKRALRRVISLIEAKDQDA
jgi:hypothetical protein